MYFHNSGKIEKHLFISIQTQSFLLSERLLAKKKTTLVPIEIDGSDFSVLLCPLLFWPYGYRGTQLPRLLVFTEHSKEPEIKCSRRYFYIYIQNYSQC